MRLRAPEPSDRGAFRAWDLDADGARALDAVPFPRSEGAARRWAEEAAARVPDGDAVFLVIEGPDGTAVGSIATHACDRRVGVFTYGVYVAPEHRRCGYAAEAVLLVLGHFFGDRRYQKASVRVASFNAASLALHQRLGFVLAGRLRREVFAHGRHHEMLAFGMTAEEFGARHGAAAGWGGTDGGGGR